MITPVFFVHPARIGDVLLAPPDQSYSDTNGFIPRRDLGRTFTRPWVAILEKSLTATEARTGAECCVRVRFPQGLYSTDGDGVQKYLIEVRRAP